MKKIITIILIFVLTGLVASNIDVYFNNKSLTSKLKTYYKAKKEYETLNSENSLYQSILNETITLEENEYQLNEKIKNQETRINTLNEEIETITNKIKELKK